MAKRKNTTTPSARAITPSPTAADTVEQRVVAFAEQLGRIVGTVQAKADGWLDRQTLDDQLTRIRDGAADLLSHLGSAAASTAAAATPAQKPTTGQTPGRRAAATTARRAPAATGRSGGEVDAPGKTHRRPAAPARGVKHSDETISKVKALQTMRRGHRRG